MQPQFALGTGVVFTYRSAVVRKKKDSWYVAEGLYKNEVHEKDPTEGFTHKDSKVNKAIITWEEQGSGIIVGYFKKGIGESYSGGMSGHSGGMFEPEYDQGYFVPKEWVWLYAIKQQLAGLELIYVKPEHLRLAG